MRFLFAFMAGGVFGAGLYVSGMTDTTKVQGWLDIFGAWDPTLAFVFAGALVPMAIAWRLTRRRRGPALGMSWPAQPDPRLDRGLIAGSVAFGAGWGLVGLCPGPAMASVGYGGWQGVVFLLAMGAGMLAAPPLRQRITPTAAA